MHRKLVLLGVVLALGGLAAGGSSASSQRPEVIRLLDVTEKFDYVDTDRSGGEIPTAGDTFLFTDGLYRWAGVKRGDRAGRLFGYCVFTSAFGCEATATAYLAGGKLQIAGHVAFGAQGVPSTISLSIVGGTGRYGGVRGTVTGRPIANTDNTAFVFRIEQ